MVYQIHLIILSNKKEDLSMPLVQFNIFIVMIYNEVNSKVYKRFTYYIIIYNNYNYLQ